MLKPGCVGADKQHNLRCADALLVRNDLIQHVAAAECVTVQVYYYFNSRVLRQILLHLCAAAVVRPRVAGVVVHPGVVYDVQTVAPKDLGKLVADPYDAEILIEGAAVAACLVAVKPRRGVCLA